MPGQGALVRKVLSFTPSSRPARVLLLAAVVGLTVLRFSALGRIPAGVYVDEASYAYNAFAIAHTGRDEHGVKLPIFFEAFGEFKSPVFIYPLAVLVRLFGLSIATARLCSALFTAGAALFAALVAVEITRRRAVFLPALLLALALPWTFTLGRFATESVSFLFLIALAWWAWLRALRTGRARWSVVSWTAWGLSLFSYGTARLLTVALVVALVWAYAGTLRRNPIRSGLTATPALLLLALYVTWAAAHPGALRARFDDISIFGDGPSVVEAAARFVGNYVGSFSLQFLFLHGDGNLRHNTGIGGELFLFMLPALVAGVAVAARKRVEPDYRFALAGLALFPAAAAFTSGGANAVRTVNAVPFIIVLTVVGLREIRTRCAGRRGVVAALAALAAFEIAIYVGDYFTRYPARSGSWFEVGLPEAVNEALAARARDAGATLFYTPETFRDEGGWVNQPYIFFLFCGALPPDVYWAHGLAGFRIAEWPAGRPVPAGSVLLEKSAETLYTLNRIPVPLENRDAIPPGSRLLWAGPAGLAPGPAVPVYRIFRTP